MEWLVEAHKELTSRPVPKLDIYYSGRFKGYNANVTYKQGVYLTFKLSKAWMDVDEDIQKGIVQHLICRAYGLKKTTMHIELYNEFLKQASKYAPRTESDAYLRNRFRAVNEQYFSGMMEEPNLVFGTFSTTKLGSYDYGTDTVTISEAMKDDEDLLDYVLYHELLHKKHQFTCKGGRTTHHSTAFRADEKLFRLPDADKKLDVFIRAQRRRKPRSRKHKNKPARGLWSFLR